MKKVLLLILLLVSIVSSAQKVEYDVVNDLLDTEFSKISHDTIFVIEQPLEKIKTLEMYKLAFSQKDIPNASFKKEVWVYPEVIKWPLNEKDVSELGKKLSKKETSWNNKDFRNKAFVILSEKKIRSVEFIKEHFSYNSQVINLSKPVFNKKRNYALLQFYPSFLIGGGSSHNSGVVLMEKKGNKWVQVAVIQPAEYN